jgi:hypothetical protein
MNLRQVGEDRYAISFPDAANFFIFKVEGAAGRTISFTFEGIPAKYWSAIRPVCGYPPSPTRGTSADLDDPVFYEDSVQGASRWHHLGRFSAITETTITYAHTFEEDSAYIALRVPFTRGYEQRWIDSVAPRRGVDVVAVGRSAEGRRLWLIKIAQPAVEDARPCIVMYGGEHADEPDANWVVEGAARFLLSEASEAAALRDQFTFLLVPRLDPDAWTHGRHEGICATFSTESATVDSIAYGTWFKQWVDQRKPLDLILNFHNPEPRAYPHVLCPQSDPDAERATLQAGFHRAMARSFEPRYRVRPEPASVGGCEDRLGTFLEQCYGGLHIPYEVNSQVVEFPLLPADLRDMGRRFVISAADFTGSSLGKLRATSDSVRADRRLALERIGTKSGQENAVATELMVSQLATAGRAARTR